MFSSLQDRTIKKQRQMPMLIRHLLESDRVCLDIACYLARYNDAADTAQGIADWWVGAEARATELALGKLAVHGIVVPHLVQDKSIYTFTKDPSLRRIVDQCLKTICRPSGIGEN